MNGADLDLPLASRAELDLQRRLARCRRHYVGNALQARLDIAQAAPDVDLELSLAWDGLPLRFLCQAPALARWLAPNLQEAAFASLPAALQLALLEREGNVFPGLVWYGLSPAQPRAAMGLRLSLERDDQGVRCMIRRVASTSALSPAPSGVSIQPGAMALTRMRSAAYSQARERVSWTMAPLLAL
ncbi:type III secretion system protein (plasmid) [Pseudomonas aeruginosa VRFPA03]|nr:type III secretion system protein [Pseudomonas aeruginosa VRFPA03]